VGFKDGKNMEDSKEDGLLATWGIEYKKYEKYENYEVKFIKSNLAPTFQACKYTFEFKFLQKLRFYNVY
jgi:hypothetical protein